MTYIKKKQKKNPKCMSLLKTKKKEKSVIAN